MHSTPFLRKPFILIFTFTKRFFMIIIKCAKCKNKIFKYVKIGQGQILRIYSGRIAEDNSIRADGEVRCQCGNIIGTESIGFIKMKKGTFTYTGRKQG